jgi:glycosyltransferase involved in cell wall biosynthesis
MNILYLCDEYPPCNHGGIGTVTQTLARSMVQRGHKVFVVGFYPYFRKSLDYETDNGVEIYRFFYGSKWKLKLSKHFIAGHFINIGKAFKIYIKKVNPFIEKFNIEIIEMPDFSEANYYGKYTNIDYSAIKAKVIVKFHGTHSYFSKTIRNKIGDFRIYKLEKQLIRNASAAIVLSEISKKTIHELYNIKIPIKKIPNGITFQNQKKYEGHHSNIIIYAGTFAEKKGVFRLISAWEIVNKLYPDYCLHMYGKGIDYFMTKLNNKIPKGISLFNAIPHEKLLEMFSKSRCAIFPSYAETLGMTPIEAMSTGCPVIFTELSTGPEIIDHMKNGILINPDNIREIADAIIYLIVNPTKSEELGEGGRIKAKSVFNIDHIAELHETFYKTILLSENTTLNNG